MRADAPQLQCFTMYRGVYQPPGTNAAAYVRHQQYATSSNLHTTPILVPEYSMTYPGIEKHELESCFISPSPREKMLLWNIFMFSSIDETFLAFECSNNLLMVIFYAPQSIQKEDVDVTLSILSVWVSVVYLT